MRTFLGLVLLSAFALCSVFGKKCEPLFSQTSPSNWGDVRQGHLEFPIPESTTKWRVDIIFDKPVHTLNPWMVPTENALQARKNVHLPTPAGMQTRMLETLN